MQSSRGPRGERMYTASQEIAPLCVCSLWVALTQANGKQQQWGNGVNREKEKVSPSHSLRCAEKQHGPHICMSVHVFSFLRNIPSCLHSSGFFLSPVSSWELENERTTEGSESGSPLSLIIWSLGFGRALLCKNECVQLCVCWVYKRVVRLFLV